MKKFFALVLALVMALSLTTVAFGAEVTVTADDGNALYQAVKNAADGDVINVPAGTYTLTNGETGRFNLSNKSVTIVGAGEGQTILKGELYGVVLSDNVNPDSTTTFTLKNMTIEAVGGRAAVYAKDDVTVNLENVTLVTAGTTAILLDSCNEIAGTFHDGVETVVNVKNVDIPDGKKVEIAANPVSSIPNAGVMSYGSVNIDEGCNFDAADVQPQNISQGLGNIEVDNEIINPGVAVVDGKHYATVQEAVDAAAVSGSDVVLWDATDSSVAIPDGYQSLKLTDGTSIVVPAQPFGDKFDLYLADVGMQAALKAKASTVAGLSFEEVGAKKNTDGSGRVAYIAANNGQFFVKTTKPTVSDYAVTYAGKTDVLYYVTVAGTDAANFYYDEEVKAFNSWGLKCGQYNNTGWTAAQKAEDYFMASDKVIYMADDAGVATNYLLDGVVVSGVALDMTKYVDHNFVASNFKYDAATGDNVPTSALCTTCSMNTSAIYKIGKAPANSIVKPLYVNGVASNVWEVVAGSTSAPVGGTVVTPSTGTTVESAQTFDAGIAMYVGMSVMAAAGSAVVIGKKKD